MEKISGKDIKEVKKAQEMFYEALNKADIEMMEQVWVAGGRAKCIHPGWPVIKGWDAIKASWMSIFESGELASIEMSDVMIDVGEKAALANCVEKLNHFVEGNVVVTFAQATNIFEITDSGWKITLHHASPIPVKSTPEDELQ
ncbi:MAG: YybH family protein [Thermodesulfobacteriota bacterium]